jgi:FKBP-type peptidyl-prolyl cis-trans isomerase 2
MSGSSSIQPYEIESSGAYVKIKYKVRIVGGPILKGVTEPEIMDFVTGYLQVVPGLEKRLVGEKQGSKLVFDIPAEEAFGLRDEKMVFVKNMEEFHFPPGYKPYPGMEISVICDAEEGPDLVTIKEVRDDGIVIDFNHNLAGKALGYELEIIEARQARSTDVCAEWDNKTQDASSCGCAPQEIVLGEGS